MDLYYDIYTNNLAFVNCRRYLVIFEFPILKDRINNFIWHIRHQSSTPLQKLFNTAKNPFNNFLTGRKIVEHLIKRSQFCFQSAHKKKHFDEKKDQVK